MIGKWSTNNAMVPKSYEDFLTLTYFWAEQCTYSNFIIPHPCHQTHTTVCQLLHMFTMQAFVCSSSPRFSSGISEYSTAAAEWPRKQTDDSDSLPAHCQNYSVAHINVFKGCVSEAVCPRNLLDIRVNTHACKTNVSGERMASKTIGLLISGQVNRLTGQIILTTCSGQNYLYWLNKSQ